MNRFDQLRIRDVAGGAAVAVKVVPAASRNRLVGPLGDCLQVATTAPPEKGKANQAVAGILAAALGVEKRDVELIAGPASGRKEFRIAGLSTRDVLQRLQGRD